MSAFRDQDIPFLLADFGDSVTIGSVTKNGILDENDTLLASDRGGGEVIVPVTTLTLRTSDFPNLAIDTSITVGGKTYKVRERLKTGDAALTKVLLGGGS
jgi:hypothetical protein